MSKDSLGFFYENEIQRPAITTCSLFQNPALEGEMMTSVCLRCGGFVIDEREADYYQTSRRRCVNCGWYRNDANVSSDRIGDRRIEASTS